MSEQEFEVNSGFYNSLNRDRLYSADDMNRPYKRLVSNGVFATPSGTSSTDLQVVSASDGMKIKVKAGEGIFADKWFENPSDIAITVPSNSNIVPRRDSVIVQIDKTLNGRIGKIIYRPGKASSNPLPPDINLESDKIEYRIANIYVASGATNINNDAIVDLRGSSECPWITSLIKQVDTSTLFNQWQYAYETYYNQATQDFENYTDEQRTAWEEFLASLTEDLTVSTNVIMLSSDYVVPYQRTNIPIGIPSYNPETDVLMVFVNGLKYTEDVNYTLNANNSSIDLKAYLSAGQNVNFVVLKSIISADLESAVTLIQNLNDQIAALKQDSGWVDFTLESGATSYDNTTKPGVRCVGDRVYLRGAFKGVTTLGSTICTLPVSYRPAQAHTFTTAAIYGTSVQDTVVMQVNTNGTIKLVASSGTLSNNAKIPIATDFILN